MKVRPSVKPICDKCKVIKRKAKILNINKDKVNLTKKIFDINTKL